MQVQAKLRRGLRSVACPALQAMSLLTLPHLAMPISSWAVITGQVPTSV